MYDVVVIGGGPGGYVAAIRAAQLGGKILLIEKDLLGGVCLNRGCIPTKTLLKSAEKWRELQHCHEFGLRAENISINFSAMMQRKEQTVTKLRDGVEKLIKSNHIDIVYGAAVLDAPTRIHVTTADGQITYYETKKIIIATGAIPMRLPLPGSELADVISSNQLLEIQQVPRSMAVIGAGAVGIEFAAIFQSFGCDVTMIEMLPMILPNVDEDIIKRMGVILRKQGLTMLTSSKVTNIKQENNGLRVSVENSKGLQELCVEKVLVATGRKAMVTELGLETIGIDYSNAGIKVNKQMETNIAGIFAIGDVTGQDMWAHVASAEGMVAAENALGANVTMDYSAVPGCIFTTPEVAMVGLTEQEAQRQQIAIKVSKFNFASNSKAVSMAETDGVVKVIAAVDSGKLLGMHIIGPHASDLIMEGAIAIRNGLTTKELSHTIHPHPSLSETVMESLHGIDGQMIHQLILNKR